MRTGIMAGSPSCEVMKRVVEVRSQARGHIAYGWTDDLDS